MKKIFIELSDDEYKEIASLYNFIKLKIGIKKAFFDGIFGNIEKETDDEKILNELKEIKRKIGLL